jgi:hypothetical protein
VPAVLAVRRGGNGGNGGVSYVDSESATGGNGATGIYLTGMGHGAPGSTGYLSGNYAESGQNTGGFVGGVRGTGMELAAVAAAAAKSLVVLAGMGVQVPRGMSLSRIP